MKIKISLFIVCLSVLLASWAMAGEDKTIYKKAMQEAKLGEIDFAFLHYRSITTDHPQSNYRLPALFAQGEYCLLNNNYKDAKVFFEDYLNNTKPKNERIFALIYLLRIAEQQKDERMSESLKEQIVNFKHHNFVFEKNKTYTYRSPLNRLLKAVYSIDKIEFYVGEDFFAQVSF